MRGTMIRAALNSIAGKGNAHFRCLGVWMGVSSALLMEDGFVGTIRNEQDAGSGLSLNSSFPKRRENALHSLS